MRTFHIILAFCAGLFTGYLLFDNEPGIPESISKPGTDPNVTLQNIDTVKVKAESILKRRNEFLAGQLLIVNSKLNESRSTLIKEREKVKAIQTQLLKDTTNCSDSTLQHNLTLQIDTLNASTDSLICDYESKIRIAESSIAIRDTQLIVCNRAYLRVQSLVEEQAARERQLTDDLNTILKQQKRKRIQNRVLALGMLFISGFTTSMIIKSKQ